MARSIKISDTLVQIAPNWSVSDRINNITTMNFVITDLLTLIEVNIGDSVDLFRDTTKIFSGIIKNISEYEPDIGRIEYSIQASDNNALADKRLIASSTVNTSAEDIITDEILTVLADEGVTAGTIACPIIIKKATFNRIKATEALNQLQTQTGYNWRIDFDKKLHFEEPSAVVAPITITDSTYLTGFTNQRSMQDYRNVQYVRGGKGETNTQTNELPTPEPDGVSRKFITRFPLAEKPIITINSVVVDPDDIGVNGLDTGKKWYFTYNSNTIVQDTLEVVLTSSDTIEITYKGLFDILAIVESLGEVAERATAEAGTSGKYEVLNEEKSIDDSDQALQFASGLIDKYARITNKISFTTEIDGLASNQLLSVNKTLFGINDSYLIESVAIRPAGTDKIQYTVNALSGESIGGWENFFKQIINTGKTYVIGQNEVLILLNTQSEQENIGGSVDIATYDMLVCSETTICSETLIISPLASEVTVND